MGQPQDVDPGPAQRTNPNFWITGQKQTDVRVPAAVAAVPWQPRRPPLRQRPSPARAGAIGAGESPRPDEELGVSESMAAAFCALFAPGDGGW